MPGTEVKTNARKRMREIEHLDISDWLFTRHSRYTGEVSWQTFHGCVGGIDEGGGICLFLSHDTEAPL